MIINIICVLSSNCPVIVQLCPVVMLKIYSTLYIFTGQMDKYVCEQIK